MLPSAWDEYGRLQRTSCRHLNDDGWTVEEQQDEFLEKYGRDPTPFDLHDCRRWLKNLARNRLRKRRQRAVALRREAPWLVRPAAPNPMEDATRNDLLTRGEGEGQRRGVAHAVGCGCRWLRHCRSPLRYGGRHFESAGLSVSPAAPGRVVSQLRKGAGRAATLAVRPRKRTSVIHTVVRPGG
jgi:hypothetical protein